ncbi:MAG: Flp family type IVb pilin [Candidatus Methylacidiphilales bacterium]
MSTKGTNKRAPSLHKKKGLTRKRGQTLVEYALILAMISLLAVLVLQQLGTTLRGLWVYIVSNVNQANTASF